ncbi:hypothetical protein BKA81DRAFT_176270 [Phyllosticta paracitricarpa]
MAILLSQRVGRERHRIKPIRIRIRIVQHTDRPREATRRMSRLHFPPPPNSSASASVLLPAYCKHEDSHLPVPLAHTGTRLKQASKARGPCPFLYACLLSGRTRDPSEARKNACVPRREPPRWARVSGLGWAEDRGEGGGTRRNGNTAEECVRGCVGDDAESASRSFGNADGGRQARDARN